MIEKEVITAFRALDINDKKNELNSELENLAMLLETVHEKVKIERLPSSVKPYNKITDQNISIDEYLTLIYENVIHIRKDVLTLANRIIEDNKQKLNTHEKNNY